MKKDISILIPLYNSENTIDACLQSIVNQFEGNSTVSWEIIVVDDGSQDAGVKRVRKWQVRYPNIKLFCKPNGGVSSARNFAIDNSVGEYIYMIDSDDELVGKVLPEIVEVMRDHSLDCVRFGYQNDIYEECHIGSVKENILFLSGKDFFDVLLKDSLVSVWTHVIKRSLIGENRFINGLNFAEDLLFLINVLIYSRNTGVLSYCPYMYRNVEGSLSRARDKERGVKKRIDCMTACQNLISFRDVHNRSMSMEAKTKLQSFINIFAEIYCFSSLIIGADSRATDQFVRFLASNNAYPFTHNAIIGNTLQHRFMAKLISIRPLFISMLRIRKVLSIN